MQFSEKLWKMWENIEILNFSQQKEEIRIIRDKLSYYKWSYYLLAIEIKSTQILMNKTVYLGLAISELIKILMYQFWYDCVKPKYDEKAKLHCMHKNWILKKMLKLTLIIQIMN